MQKDEKKKAVLKVLINLLGLAVVALGLTFLMIYRQFLNSYEDVVEFVEERGKVFYYSALIIYVWLIFLTAVLRRANRSVLVTFILIVGLTYVSMCKFRLRGTPFLPEEFGLAGEAGSLMDFIDVGEFVRLIIALVLSVVLTIIIGKIIKRAKLEVFPKRAFLARGATAVASLVVLMGLTGFIFHRAGLKYEDVEFLDTTLIAWNQTSNYNENGFLIGFLYNLSKLELKAPEGYTKEKLEAISGEYEAKAKKENASESGESVAEKPNVVIILNESFIDAEIMREYAQYNFSGGDVTPNLHAIEEKAMSGLMFSPDYGGGTANVEFEVLTGLTNFWLDTVPYTNLLSKRDNIESIASELKDLGYATVAIHPYNGGMYKRNIVLKNEGFDKFITETEMNFLETEPGSDYINDWSAYQETLKELREDEAGKKKLVFLITMQNHAPFWGDYNDGEEFLLTEDYTGERREEIEGYLKRLNKSDEYLGELISEIDNLGEKTVVLFFGDHSPGLFPERRREESLEEVKRTSLTPYFIYANYDLENEDYVRGGKLETVTPNCMVAKMKELVKLPETALGMLTREVCEETPVLTSLYYDYEEIEETELLKKYELTTYDLVAGKRYFRK
ncbi:sulfatase-like hydrolase/transferase [Candidatus Saccharibacteria bacterium]|nr:sulfatase-like hydrolase/transferase [Candidatus Saccharibacteria bacterium]